MTPRCSACLSYRARTDVYGHCWEPERAEFSEGGRVTLYPRLMAAGQSCAHFRDKIANRAEVEAWQTDARP